MNSIIEANQFNAITLGKGMDTIKSQQNALGKAVDTIDRLDLRNEKLQNENDDLKDQKIKGMENELKEKRNEIQSLKVDNARANGNRGRRSQERDPMLWMLTEEEQGELLRRIQHIHEMSDRVRNQEIGVEEAEVEVAALMHTMRMVSLKKVIMEMSTDALEHLGRFS